MTLTKTQRAALKDRFGGRCAYCGCVLGDRWHADHMHPVERKLKFHPTKGAVATSELWHPENDTIENMMPSCAPCNIDKHSLTLETWRSKLQRATDVLTKNNPTYRHALRFGLLAETGIKVVFYFEVKKGSAA